MWNIFKKRKYLKRTKEENIKIDTLTKDTFEPLKSNRYIVVFPQEYSIPQFVSRAVCFMEDKIVKISFIRENRNNRAVITVQNTYSNKNVDIEKIFEKGKSGKENHSGIGLWEVRNYVKKSKNLDLFTTKTDKFFKQELSIYDL